MSRPDTIMPATFAPSAWNRTKNVGLRGIALAAGALGVFFCSPEGRAATDATSASCFLIRVVDGETSRGVPLIQLTTACGIGMVTDSAGHAAFDELSLMDRDVYFNVSGHGYSHKADGFGTRGRLLRTTPGTSASVVVQRENIAERLYRITGSGIYADTVKAGLPAPIREPLLNCGVMGQDSVLCTLYRGRMFWAWGDTVSTKHPLSGNYHATAAWSDLPEKGGLDPEIGVDLSYFCENGFVKPMVKMPKKSIYWLSCLTAAPDAAGRERLVSRYVRIEPPMTAVEHGTVEFDDEEEVFKLLQRDADDALIKPAGHGFPVRRPSGEWYYSAHATRTMRVPHSYEGHRDPAAREAFTCLLDGQRFTTAPATVSILDRSATGGLRFSWKKATSPVGYSEQEMLIKAGMIAPEERWFHFLDANTGKPLIPHGTMVAWNPWRKRWTAVVSEIFGTSVLGEVWYAEADRPEGPWTYAQKVATHDRYSLYNPILHPELAKDGGRTVFFEGTYTELFSGAPVQTPRYEYNQIMYKMELDDPKLCLPVPVYRRADGSAAPGAPRPEDDTDFDQMDIAFYAPDRPRPGCVPMGAGKPGEAPDFYALPPDAAPDNPACVALYEAEEKSSGRRTWTAGEESAPPGWTRSDKAAGYVWKNPAAGRLK